MSTNPLSEREIRNIFRVFNDPQLGNGNKTKTAEITGLSMSTVKRYLKGKVAKERGRPKNNTWLRNSVVFAFLAMVIFRCCCLYLWELAIVVEHTFDIPRPSESNLCKILKELKV